MTLARRLLLVLLGLALGAGAFVCRCYSLRDTFIDGRIYFVDDDCYSRMTRVREIAQHPGTIIRHHSFENFPYGVHSHASAPFDYLIFFLKRLLDFCFAHSSSGRTSLLAAQTGDLAGALVSPLLGALTTVFLGYWGWRMTRELASGDDFTKNGAGLRWCAALAPAMLFAVSPILADGTQLGRPDHQSLLMALLTVALAGEAMLWIRRPSPDLIGEKGRGRWGAATGLAWGMALWVSLYEPSILLLATAVFLLIFARASLRSRARLWEAGGILALLAAALLVEGWPFEALPPEVMRYFPAWSKTISELRHLSPWDPSFPQGLGWLCLAAPLLLGAAAVLQDQRAWIWLSLGLLTFVLTCWQIRWFYYFGLVFCLSLPWQIAALRRVWIAAPLFLLALYPVAQAWEAALFPDDASCDKAISRRRERVLLRDAAQHLQGRLAAALYRHLLGVAAPGLLVGPAGSRRQLA